ncbi:hypothetical protein RvY_06872 [Ramazzottius varieornatus]|uniref:RING-type E3 ubiquitin transferase n=1 Tax=Ramazzottius varieornatus TaxID=947166 RepID=A0A1D1V049_RAMVA|nr:hypothetical protein RvY_06872 [Ramazzottius varieornatus]
MTTRLDPSTLRCRYHPNCNRKGCYYSHDPETIASNICRFYLAGCCFYGEECRFAHYLPYNLAGHDEDINLHLKSAGEPVVIEAPPSQPAPPAPVSSASAQNRGPVTRSSTRACAAAAVDPSKPSKHVKKGRKMSPNKRQHVHESSEGTSRDSGIVEVSQVEIRPKTQPPLCQLGLTKMCPLIDCNYRHGDVCDMCQSQALDPLDAAQCETHRQECLVNFEKNLKAAFEAQESAEVQCQICLDTVLNPKKAEEKERRFGLLEKCEHPFCLSCVMQWRKQPTEDATTKTFRSCPTCRQPSYFVVPSKIWPKTKEEKEEALSEFKTKMGKRPCRKFNNGRGKCKFGSECWYLHAKEDGTIVTLPPPRLRIPGVVHMEYLEDGLDFDIDVEDEYADDGDYYSGADDDDEYLDMLNITHELMEAGIPDEDALHYVFGNGDNA